MSELMSEADQLIQLIESDLYRGIQLEIMELWKQRGAQEWTRTMPLCIPGEAGALPVGWLEWSLRAVPHVLTVVKNAMPYAVIQEVTLPVGWDGPQYGTLAAPRITIRLTVDADPVEVPGLLEALIPLGGSPKLRAPGIVHHTIGPRDLVLLEISMDSRLWRERWKAETAAKKAAMVVPPAAPSGEPTPAEPPPVANLGSDSEIPF